MAAKDRRSERFGTKGVALPEIARRQSAIQPALPLRARAVSKCFRHHASLRLLLQPVVAYGARRIQPVPEVTGFDQLRVVLLRRVGPDTRKTIGLQLHTH